MADFGSTVDLAVTLYANIRSMQGQAQVVCVLIPRFTLLTALGDAPRAAAGARSRWRPSPTASRSWARCRARPRRTGSTPGCGWARRSRAAPGCGSCRPTPSARRAAWESVLAALEGIGAAVEPAAPGRGLLRAGGAAPAVRRPPRGSARARRAGRSRMPARLGAAPSRFCAFAAAAPRAAGARRARSFPPARSARSSRRCRSRCCARGCRLAARAAATSDALERLGVRTLGELAALAAAEVADRFGRPGLRARELALGARHAAAPARRRGELLAERIELPEAVVRHPARAHARAADRPAAGAAASGAGARFASCAWARASSSRATWRREVTLRQATADARAAAAGAGAEAGRAAGADRAAAA